MSEVRDRVSIELPGVGEIKARPGTSTIHLAGMASFWHGKYKSARKDGFIAAVALISVLEILSGIAYHYLRSR